MTEHVDQQRVLDFLADPRSHHPSPPRVDRIDTHGAIVFLAGDTVYKVKRAVRYDYMDFSSLARRRAVCRREYDLNSRTAPQIYRDTVAITCQGNGKLAIGGDGRPVEWAVRMNRFDEACVLARIAERDELTTTMARDLGLMAARLHESVRPVHGIDGSVLVAEIVEELARVLPELATVLPEADGRRLVARLRDALERIRPVLDDRSRAGRVRHCHGDLHLRNLVLIDGEIVAFDALEFDQRLATTDVLYDLAFLLMDLLHRQLPVQANLTFNTYLGRTGDLGGLAALPAFLALRAAIRAMVTAQAVLQAPDGRPAAGDEARVYLEAALRFLDPPPARLLAVGGLSGTGKSTLAGALAPLLGRAPGALHLRSDVERKRMFATAETSPLDPRAYRPAVTARVYRRLLDAARTALQAGHSVVLDAVYQRPEERQAARDLAAVCGVPFTGLWLAADTETLVRRVEARRGDASDADAAVVRAQSGRSAGPVDWMRIDAGGPAHRTLAVARQALNL